MPVAVAEADDVADADEDMEPVTELVADPLRLPVRDALPVRLVLGDLECDPVALVVGQ